MPRLALYALDVRQQLYDHVAPLCVTSSSSFLFALFVPARAQLIVKLITARPFHAVRSLIERRFPPTKIDLDGNGYFPCSVGEVPPWGPEVGITARDRMVRDHEAAARKKAAAAAAAAAARRPKA